MACRELAWDASAVSGRCHLDSERKSRFMITSLAPPRSLRTRVMVGTWRLSLGLCRSLNGGRRDIRLFASRQTPLFAMGENQGQSRVARGRPHAACVRYIFRLSKGRRPRARGWSGGKGLGARAGDDMRGRTILLVKELVARMAHSHRNIRDHIAVELPRT